ncbi:MAG: hypothetical protein BRC24_02120 [Parcubacteria group bacterium SW_4_46_8]|nr:MAG: hypothetical protein BRC24_02120 [Parcubacteria group bacterium SW_4_46_8]
MDTNDTDTIFFTNFFQKRKAIQTLIEESRADADFYLFLVFSAFITTLGLLLDNPVVIIGAMLIAPILFPILSIGMGVVTFSTEAIMDGLKILGESVATVVGVSYFTSFLVEVNTITDQLSLFLDPNLVYFLVAIFSGIVAAFAWVRKEHSDPLPGVAITVSLVPPLSAFGVALTILSRDILVGSLLLFVVNLFGIVMASIIVFSLFGFSQAELQEYQEERIAAEERNQE